jgi:hypothetical protein
MKIVVNKTAGEFRKQEIINEILAQAKETADKGLNSFTYHFKEDIQYKLPGSSITLEIAKITEGTVNCSHRGNYGHKIRFVIKES